MEAVANARAHARVLGASLSSLDAQVQASEAAMPQQDVAQLRSAASDFRTADEALGTAVGTALTLSTLPKDAKRSAAAAASSAVDTAEASTAQARAAILSMQQASVATGAAATPVVNEAAGVLADSEQAIQAARIAVNQATRRLSRVHYKSVQAAAITLVPASLIAVLYWQVEPAPGQLWSLIFATVVIVAGLLVLIATGGEHGLLGPIVGADNRVSTSKTQLALWTVAVGFALAFLLGRVLWDGASLEIVLPDARFDEYLILLGGPFAAGVVAKAAVTWKTENGQLQKTTAPEANPSQIVEDDNGNPSLVDAQYLLFNVVALGYFAVSLAQTLVLPTIPLVLFGLTSVSAATYAAAKVAESNAPVITSVSPRSCLPGGQIRVSGYNFVSGTDAREVSQVGILIEGYAHELRPLLTSRGSDLAVDLPTDLPFGTRGLTVRTSARVVSAPYLIQVLENKPLLFGIQGAPTPGDNVTATGRNLLSPGSVGTEKVGVLVGGKNEEGTATADTVSFKIPAELTSGMDAQVTVTRAGSTSDPITVHLA